MRRKWSPSSRGFAALGVLLATAAFVLVHGYAQRVHALGAAVGHPVPVVVASQPLERGAVVSEESLRVRAFPSVYAPPGAVRRIGDAVGRALLAPLAPGEPLTVGRLAPPGGPLAALVPPGFRAVAIAAALTPRSVRAGDHVDVLATFGGSRAHTETVVTEVEVLQAIADQPSDAVGSSSSFGQSILVLLVDPSQAEQLAFARAFADLSVSVDAPEEVVVPEGS